MSIRTQQSYGFTIVELMVVVSIMAIMSVIVLSNYRGYSTNAEFANASEDIVLALRQAQVYGSSSKKNVDANGASITCGTPASAFSCAYGVYFEVGKNNIIIFADTNGNGVYDLAGDTVVETISWRSPISITGTRCSVLSCVNSVLSVTFKRPNPDAIIRVDSAMSLPSGNIMISNGISGAGVKKNIITISSTGQISLQQI